MVESNKEHGEGRSDVVVYDPEEGRVAIFEAKYSKTLETMDTDCQKALDQINKKCMQKNMKMILITFCAMVFPFLRNAAV